MATGPLDGIKLLEFTQIIAGPMGCQMLSDLGADVIKVEPIEGEPWRLNAQFIPKESVTFLGLNRGNHPGLVALQLRVTGLPGAARKLRFRLLHPGLGGFVSALEGIVVITTD